MAQSDEIKILVRAEVDKAVKDISRITAQTKDMSTQSKKSAKDIAGLSNAFKAFGGVFVASKIAGGIKAIVKSATDFEQLQVSFTTFLGSAQKANQVLGQLEKFSIATPFNVDQVNRAGKSLLAFGIAAEDLEPSLKAIGDLAAGTGKDFNELATIYGKARVQGTLFAEDINQLTEAGIPIIDEFARLTGVSTSEIKKMGSEGKLNFDLLQQAFVDMTSDGGQFFDLMEKQSQTVGGRISTLEGSFQLLQRSLGQKMMPVVEAVIGALERLVANEDAMQGLADSGKLVASAFSVVFSVVLSLVDGVKSFITQTVTFFGAIGKAAKEVANGNILSAVDIMRNADAKLREEQEGSIERQKNIWNDFLQTQKDVWSESAKAAQQGSQKIQQAARDASAVASGAIEAESDVFEKITELRKFTNETLKNSDQELALIRLENLHAELESEELTKEERIRIAQEAAEEINKIDTGLLLDKMKRDIEYMKFFKGIQDDLFGVVNQFYQNDIKELDARLERGEISEEHHAREVAKIKQKQFRVQKATNIATAVINGAVAFTQAIAQLGPIAGPALGGLMLALTAAQVAAIASEPEPAIPAFASGTMSAPGGPALVGEEGPEIVNIPRGSQVLTADETRGVLGGNTFNIENVNLPNATDGDSFLADINSFSREYGETRVSV